MVKKSLLYLVFFWLQRRSHSCTVVGFCTEWSTQLGRLHLKIWDAICRQMFFWIYMDIHILILCIQFLAPCYHWTLYSYTHTWNLFYYSHVLYEPFRSNAFSPCLSLHHSTIFVCLVLISGSGSVPGIGMFIFSFIIHDSSPPWSWYSIENSGLTGSLVSFGRLHCQSVSERI